MLLAALSPAGVEVGINLRHRGGVVDGEGWVVGIVVVSLVHHMRSCLDGHPRNRL